MSLEQFCEKYQSHVLNSNSILSFSEFNSRFKTAIPTSVKVFEIFLRKCDEIRKEFNLEASELLPRTPNLMSIFNENKVAPETKTKHSRSQTNVEQEPIQKLAQMEVQDSSANAFKPKTLNVETEQNEVTCENCELSDCECDYEEDEYDVCEECGNSPDECDCSEWTDNEEELCSNSNEHECTVEKMEEHRLEFKPLQLTSVSTDESHNEEQKFCNSLMQFYPEQMQNIVVMIPPSTNKNITKEDLDKTSFRIEDNLQNLQKFVSSESTNGGLPIRLLNGEIVKCEKLQIQWGEEEKISHFEPSSEKFMCLHLSEGF